MFNFEKPIDMKHMRLFAILALSALMFTSCKDEKGAVSLTFKAVYDGEPLVMFEGKQFDGPRSIEFSTLNFFLSDVQLEKSDGSSVLLDDIELVDLSATTLAGASAGTTLEFNDLDPGTYERITFGIGVPDDMNRRIPTDYSSDHPLSNTAFYWNGWYSYIFSKTEGNMDTLGNGTYDLGWLVHTGSSIDSNGVLNFNCYRSFATPQMIDILEEQTTDIELVIDFKELLQDPDETPFNLHEKPRNHTPNDTARIKHFVDNYLTGITIRN